MPNIVCETDRLINNCRICDSDSLESVINLGFQPWCGNFLKKEGIGAEPFYPLHVFFCHSCKTPQLNYTIPKEVMFSEHTYLSNITKTLNEHFKNTAEEIDKKFFKDEPDKSMLDIGSNDGAQMQYFKNLGYEILGIESAKTPAAIANDAGLTTIHDFFNLNLAKKVDRKFNIINASGVFFHLEELHSVADGIRESLKKNGVFLVQFLYMKKIIENLAFDQIYHEHLLYYTLFNIEKLLNMHGLAMFDAYLSPIHGGSIIGYATHLGLKPPSENLKKLRLMEQKDKTNEFGTYEYFFKKINKMRDDNLKYLEATKQSGKKMFGFGAPAKGNTLLNYFGIGKNYLELLVEKNRLRDGLFSPGTHIPIVMEDNLLSPPDFYYVLAWNFKKEILEKNQRLVSSGTEFYFPVNPGA